MTTQITTVSLETLAQKLNGNLWTKGEIKRIYLDRGWNTKKMSTKTYVYQKQDGSFGVSCNITCSSQPFQWIDSQEQEVIQGVEKEIENVIAQANAILVNHKIVNDCEVMVYVKENPEAEAVWYTEEIFHERFGCDATALFEGLPKFEKVVEPLIEQQPTKEQRELKPIVDTETPEYGVNAKVKHSKFGVGVVLAEDAIKIEIDFPEVGKKQLVKKFVTLQIVE